MYTLFRSICCLCFLLQFPFLFFRFRLLLCVPSRPIKPISSLSKFPTTNKTTSFHSYSLSPLPYLCLSASLSFSLFLSFLSPLLPLPLIAHRCCCCCLMMSKWLPSFGFVGPSLSLRVSIVPTFASWQFVNTNMLQTCSQVFGRGGGEREGRQQSPADGHIDNFLLFSFFWTLRKSNDCARHFALNEL